MSPQIFNLFMDGIVREVNNFGRVCERRTLRVNVRKSKVIRFSKT